MITLRPAAERGAADHGWLDTRFSFSFADYHDPSHMGYRALRVLNEDVVAAGTGFGPHPHRDMEILTWVLSGAVQHADDTGGTSVLRAGEIQRMTAGRGIVHSETNPFDEALHLLQIWILPDERGSQPGYEQQAVDDAALRAGLVLLASPDRRDGSLALGADAQVYAGRPTAGTELRHTLERGRGAWVQVARGRLTLNGQTLGAGDGASVEGVSTLDLVALEDSELLLLDLAGATRRGGPRCRAERLRSLAGRAPATRPAGPGRA